MQRYVAVLPFLAFGSDEFMVKLLQGVSIMFAIRSNFSEVNLNHMITLDQNKLHCRYQNVFQDDIVGFNIHHFIFLRVDR